MSEGVPGATPEPAAEPRADRPGGNWGRWAREKALSALHYRRRGREAAREPRDAEEEEAERARSLARRKSRNPLTRYRNMVNNYLIHEERRLGIGERPARVRLLEESRIAAAEQANRDGGTHANGGGHARGQKI